MSDPERLSPSSDCPDLGNLIDSPPPKAKIRRTSSYPPHGEESPGVYRMLATDPPPTRRASPPGTAPSPRWEGGTLPAGRVPDFQTLEPRTEVVLGDVLAARYELIAKVRTGGMGTIWRARDLRLDGEV